jgi:hypothetical protein
MIDTRYFYEISPVFSVVAGGSYCYQITQTLYAILESTTELWQQRMSPKSFKFKIHWNPDKSTYLFY